MSRFAAACEVAAIAAGLLLGACDSGSGPVDVKLGRDVCEMCGMIISDPRFLAEVRLADGKYPQVRRRRRRGELALFGLPWARRHQGILGDRQRQGQDLA